MKKIKTISTIGLAVILMAIVTAVSACARTQNPVSFAVDYTEGMFWAASHPKDAVDIFSASLSRDDVETVKDLVDNSEGAKKFVNAYNFPNSLGGIIKFGLETANPKNSNPDKVIMLNVSKPIQYSTGTETGTRGKIPEYNIFSLPLFYKNKITFDPFGIYKTSNDELIVLAVIENYSNQNVEISGIPEVQLNADGKQIAAGQTSDFGTLSYYQKRADNGIYNGMPNAAFVIMTFEPGTYDPNVDITSLDNLSCNYSLDYTYLN